MSALELLLVLVYVACALLLSAYGLHRYLMTWLYWRTRDRAPEPRELSAWPRVTVQLPVFNERDVVVRLIEAAAAIDYPRDRLEIQVLDDSTDDTTELARACAARLRDEGLEVRVIRRPDRVGFKAGALAWGLRSARGEFVAVFDADFLPTRDFLKQVLPHFREGVGMVQARWGHINDESSLLTRLQAVLLDGHFVIEHTARNRSGRWFNFNGTAGVWRRQAIEDAGGWQHDTLTEDLDLSYRSQLAGWRFVYLPELVVPAELPPTMRAFKSQQHRWAKGSIQTMKKLTGRLLRADIPLKVRLEAAVHLSNNLAYPLVVLLTMLTPLAVVVRARHVETWLVFDLFVFAAGTFGVGLFYAVSQWAAYEDWGRRILRIPAVMALGIGLAVNQSRAVVQALLGQDSPFVRTPKFGSGQGSYSLRLDWTAGAELMLALWHLGGLAFALHHAYWPSVPIQLLFCAGFATVGLSSLRSRPPARPAVEAA